MMYKIIVNQWRAYNKPFFVSIVGNTHIDLLLEVAVFFFRPL
jgi:hypothetical protein